MSRSLFEVRVDSELEWVTSHAWRKTTARILDGPGVTARTIADQLGNSQVSMAQDVYLGRAERDPRVLAALEAVDPRPALEIESGGRTRDLRSRELAKEIEPSAPYLQEHRTCETTVTDSAQLSTEDTYISAGRSTLWTTRSVQSVVFGVAPGWADGGVLEGLTRAENLRGCTRGRATQWSPGPVPYLLPAGRCAKIRVVTLWPIRRPTHPDGCCEPQELHLLWPGWAATPSS